jgi:hypothetical protein
LTLFECRKPIIAYCKICGIQSTVYNLSDILDVYIYVPFFIKHKTDEIAMITATTPSTDTPSTLPRITPPLALDPV